MKIKKLAVLSIWYAIAVLSCNCILASETSNPRKTLQFNREWKYIQGDPNQAESIDKDDSGWESVGLPHSFSIPYFLSNDFYIGYGWYRKGFYLDKKEIGKKIFLEFDGVFQETELFVNGQKVGDHFGGYTGFNMDISQAVKAGKNQIAIRVNNFWRSDKAPRAGEHVFSGGIYRNVRLVIKDPTYIDWYGTFVTTPDLALNEGKSSSVQIQTDLCNHSSKAVSVRLETVVLDAHGKKITSTQSQATLAAHSEMKLTQTTEEIKNPRLWHPSQPHLYKVISSLYQGKRLLDQEETTFGFRWFEWTADRGFFLNGEPHYFKGANVHQDHAGWGDAVTESGSRRDVQLMKEAGFDFIRGSHYPHSPAFSKACDEIGMLFWSEATFWGIGGHKDDGYWNSSAYPIYEKDRKGFDNSAKEQLAAMIRIHRNHPSIIVWSMSNEPFFSAPEAMDGVRNLLKEMVELSRQLDPTRPAAIGGAQRPLGEGRIDLIGDVVGYNGDGATIPEFQNPGIPNVVSEYGSTTSDRPGNYEPGWGDLGKSNTQNGISWRSGQAIWCGFDHGSIAGSALGKMGMVDYFRIPKRMWYWYRNEYRQIPPPDWPQKGTASRLKLTADRTHNILTDGTDDVMLTVTVLDAMGNEITNSPPVEFTLVSGPGEFPTGRAIRFAPDSDIRIADGKAAIEFRSYYAGTSVIRATSPGLEPAEVTLEFAGGPLFKEGETQLVKERPYIRYKAGEHSRTPQRFGPNNPTFSSSSAPGHSAGLGADGNLQTFWKPAENDPQAWWTLDTEKNLNLIQIAIDFPRSASYRYKVEVSENQSDWRTVFLKDQENLEESHRKIILDDLVNGRFVRLTFLSKLAEVSEVSVTGIVKE